MSTKNLRPLASLPLSLSVLKYFLTRKGEALSLKTQEYTNATHTHTNTHREKKVDRAQQGGTERMRDYQMGNQNTTFNWIIARYPKAGSQ